MVDELNQDDPNAISAGDNAGDGSPTAPQFTDLIDGKPLETWNAFYGKYKTAVEQSRAYSELGDINEVKKNLQTFREWQKKVEEYQNQQNMSPDEKTEQQKQQAILKELYKVMPGLKKLEMLDDLQKKVSQYEENQTTSEIMQNAQKASAAFGDAVKAAKIDPKFQDDIEVWLWNKMDETQQDLIRQGDASEAIKMFNDLNKTGMFSGMKIQNLPKPPLRNAPGGTPPKGQPPKGKTFDEATNAAWETFSNAE